MCSKAFKTAVSALLMLLFWAVPSIAQDSLSSERKVYTREHPLVFEGPWDMWPYSYIERGRAEGFSVEIIKALLDRLDIPFRIKLVDAKDMSSDLSSGAADVTIHYRQRFSNLHYSKSVMTSLSYGVAYPAGKPHIKSLDELAEKPSVPVYVRDSSRICMTLYEMGVADNVELSRSLKGELFHVSEVGEGQVLWNVMSLKWLITKYQLTNMRVESIEMDQGNFRLLSRYGDLVEQLDSVYMEMMTAGELDDIYLKWYYPEEQASKMPRYAWYVVVALGLICLLMLAVYLFYRRMGRRAGGLVRRQNARLSNVLEASHVTLWTYDVGRNLFTTYDQKFSSRKERTLEELQETMSEADFEQTRLALRRIVTGETEQEIFYEYSPSETEPGKTRISEITLSLLERGSDGYPKMVLGMRRDITEERQMHAEEETTLNLYEEIFNNSVIGMMMFDRAGRVVQINSEAAQMLGIADIGAWLEEGHNVDEIEAFRGIDVNNADPTLNFTSRIGEHYYVRMMLTPIRDEQGKADRYCLQLRDLTDSVSAYKRGQEETNRQRQMNDKMERMVKKVNYVLQNSDTQVIAYLPDERSAVLYHAIGIDQKTISELQLLKMVHPSSMSLIIDQLEKCDAKVDGTFELTLRSAFKNSDGSERYLICNMVDIKDSEGRIIRYFGTLANDSKMIAAKMHLEKEKNKAQEGELVKSAFLRNMSYEIRTPLNAVVGFSDLLGQAETEDDQRTFVSEIKKNTNTLLSLINDVLLLSRLDAKMIESKTQEVDLAAAFESCCATVWGQCKHADGVELQVESPYDRIVMTLDWAHLQDVMRRFIENAARFTSKGFVRVHYEYMGGSITVTVEDTGNGIPKEHLDKVMERFTKTGTSDGTGLGLPICQELAELMGGHIGIESSEGDGTTAWVSVPCNVSNMTKKKVMYVSEKE